MSDRFTETRTIGYLQRIGKSFVGIVIGILLFLGSFFLLHWNEGRIDLSQVAETSIAIPETGAASAEIGTFVSVTGTLTSEETLGDNLFLAPGDYIALERESEMYAWKETKKIRKRKNTGGSETRTTTYTYHEGWEEKPEKSSSFKRPNGHENPPKKIPSRSFHVSSSQVGQYQLDLQRLKFPVSSVVTLSSDKLLPSSDAIQSGPYLFVGQGTLQAPKIGDLRIQYKALENGAQVTVLGKLSNRKEISAYLGPQNSEIYRLLLGNRTQAFSTLSQEHQLLTWRLRGVGFLMMWIGMELIFEPLSVFLDLLPFLGALSRWAVRVVTLITSLSLSILTIFLSIILHNPIMVFGACGLGFFVLFWWLRQKRK